MQSLRIATAESGEQPKQGPYLPTVACPHSGSTLIDTLLVRALAGRKALLLRITEWRRRVAERRELMTLTDRDLHDIRIGRIEAEVEANKPFWEP
jgi:uncharacterized protein YjiS (DUF1127 family)